MPHHPARARRRASPPSPRSPRPYAVPASPAPRRPPRRSRSRRRPRCTRCWSPRSADRRRRRPRARRDRHRARGRGPRRRARRACCRETPSRSSRRGRRCRTSGSRPSPTPSAGGWPSCAGWRTPTPPIRSPARSTCSSPRCARSCSRWSPASATSSRCGCAPGDEIAMDDLVARLVGRGVRRGSTWSSKRGEFAVRGGILDVLPARPRSTRCAWSSGATPSRRSAAFKVADQRSLEVAADGLWAPPCRELLLTDEVRAAGRGARRARTPAGRDAATSSPRASPSRAWSRSRRCSSTAWSCSLDLLPAGTLSRAAATPSGSARAPTTSCARAQEFLDGVVAQRGGGQRDADRPGRGVLPLELADVRAHAARAGVPWWWLLAVRRRRGAAPTSRRRRRTRRPHPRRRARAPRVLPRRHRAALADVRDLAARRAGASCSSPRATASAERLVEAAARRGLARRRGRAARPDGRPEPGRGARGHGRPASTASSSTRAAARGAHRDRPRRPAAVDQGHAPHCRSPAPAPIDPLQLRPGDYVVHEQHGVGRYVEMVQRTVAGADARVPRARVRRRASAASRRDRLLRADRPARPGHPVRRRRGAQPCTGSAAPTGRRPRAARARRSRRSPAS